MRAATRLARGSRGRRAPRGGGGGEVQVFRNESLGAWKMAGAAASLQAVAALAFAATGMARPDLVGLASSEHQMVAAGAAGVAAGIDIAVRSFASRQVQGIWLDAAAERVTVRTVGAKAPLRAALADVDASGSAAKDVRLRLPGAKKALWVDLAAGEMLDAGGFASVVGGVGGGGPTGGGRRRTEEEDEGW